MLAGCNQDQKPIATLRARRCLFCLRGTLDRGRFVAGILFGLAALITLALIVLDGQAGGHMGESAFWGHLILMLALMAWLLPLTLRRAFDLDWSPAKAWLAVFGSVVLFPFLTLVFMALPGRPARVGDVAPLPKLAVAAAPVVGLIGGGLASLVFSRAL
jgi:uncharacterized membrane protein YhaH (DUF805 family)